MQFPNYLILASSAPRTLWMREFYVEGKQNYFE